MTDKQDNEQTLEHSDTAHRFRPKKLTTQDIRDGCIYLTNGDAEETRICVVNEELRQGIEFIEQCERSVTFFGSARTKANEAHYQAAYRLAKRVAELGYAVVSGGGPGIMEAANRGAHDADGKSIGMTIKLPGEQHTNPYVTEELPFYYFFTRKVTMSYSAEVYLMFPGGFGTMDEAFEMLTLIQTNKIAKVPVVFVGVEFWSPLMEFIKNTLRDQFKTISPEDVDLITMTDDEDEIMEIIKNAPVRISD